LRVATTAKCSVSEQYVANFAPMRIGSVTA
jgi:hypothetical protein